MLLNIPVLQVTEVKNNLLIQSVCFFFLNYHKSDWHNIYMVAVLLFNKHNKFSSYPSDQSVPISSEWLKSFISFLCGSVLIVPKLCGIRPFDVTLTPLCLNLNISYNVYAAISHYLQSRLLSYLNLFMFFASKSYLHIVNGKLFHPREPKENNLLINSSKNSSKMRLWWTSWD